MQNQDNNLNFIQQCPMCQEKYRDDCFFIVEKKEKLRLVHITCNVCSHAVIAIIGLTGTGLSSLAVVTDLDKNDIIRLYNRGSITQNDVFAFHKLLRENTEQFLYSVKK